MKKLVLTIICALTLVAGQAQFKVDDQAINAGIGLGSTLGGGLPISVSYEKGFKDGIFDKGVLSYGGLLGFASYSEDFGFGIKWNYTYIVIGARLGLHYPLLSNEKLDTYAGLMLGYNYAKVSWGGTGTSLITPSAGGIGIGAYLGARYYFTDNIAAFAELGYSVAYANLGVAYKF